MSRLFRRLLSRPQSANRPRPPARRPRPSVELLEDRLVPTVFFQPQLGAESPVPGHNGPTLSNTPVTLIFEGSYWQSPTGITENDVIQSAQNIFNSSFLSSATQYGTNGHAFLAGTVEDNSLALSGGQFTEANLKAVAAKFVTDGLVAPSARGLYLVITAPGVSDATRPTIGGFHNELTHNVPSGPFGIFNTPEEVPFGWVGTFASGRQAQTDGFSELFSHELVESVTDPFIQTQSANFFFHGSNFQSDESFDEIADFEPDSARYTFRLGNGTLAQAYWSQKDQMFVVPDGTTQTFTLTPRFTTPPPGGTLSQSNFTGQFDLTVNGDQLLGKDDRFTVQAITSGPQAGGLLVTLNGETVAIDPNKLVNLTLNSGTGNDAVDVESLPSGVTLTVNLGAGHDAVTLGQVGGQLDGLAGNVNIHGGGANSSLTVNDSATANSSIFRFAPRHSVDWFVNGSSLTRYDTVHNPLVVLGGNSTQYYSTFVTYSGLGKIDLFGGNCPNTYNVQAAGLSTPLAVHGSGTNNSLTFDDSTNSDNAGTAYTVTAGQVTRVGTDRFFFLGHPFFFFHTTSVSYAGVQSLLVEGGLSGNTVTVQGTATNTATTILAGAGNDVVNVLATGVGGPLTVNGAGGSDLVRVGSVSASAADTGREGGTLANIQGVVTVSNSAGTATLVLDDSGDPASYFGVNVGSGSLTGVGGAAAVHWSGTPALLYLGGTAGAAGDTVFVNAAVSGDLPEIFTGPGDDTVDVFNPSVNNTLKVHGGGGNDTVNVIDPAFAAATYAFDGATLTRTGHNPDGSVNGVFTLAVDNIARVLVNSAAV